MVAKWIYTGLGQVTRATCAACDGVIGEFRDDLSVEEYLISKLCQECQDRVFGMCGPDNEDCHHEKR